MNAKYDMWRLFIMKIVLKYLRVRVKELTFSVFFFFSLFTLAASYASLYLYLVWQDNGWQRLRLCVTRFQIDFSPGQNFSNLYFLSFILNETARR